MSEANIPCSEKQSVRFILTRESSDIIKVDVKLAYDISEAISDKADKIHTHIVGDVTGLPQAIAAINSSLSGISSDVGSLHEDKQDKLTPGNGISIRDGVIFSDVTSVNSKTGAVVLTANDIEYGDSYHPDGTVGGKINRLELDIGGKIGSLNTAVDSLVEQKADKSSIPTRLPTLGKLTFTGAVSASFDGSSPVTINIPTGGSGSSGGGGGGDVTSVAGKTGNVTLTAEDITYDEKDYYSPGTVGGGISKMKRSIDDKIELIQTNVTNLSDELTYKADRTSIPKKLPTPNKLTFTGAVSAEFDGSSPVSINIPTGGSGSGAVLDSFIVTFSFDSEAWEASQIERYICDKTLEEILQAYRARRNVIGIYNEYYGSTIYVGDYGDDSFCEFTFLETGAYDGEYYSVLHTFLINNDGVSYSSAGLDDSNDVMYVSIEWNSDFDGYMCSEAVGDIRSAAQSGKVVVANVRLGDSEPYRPADYITLQLYRWVGDVIYFTGFSVSTGVVSFFQATVGPNNHASVSNVALTSNIGGNTSSGVSDDYIVTFYDDGFNEDGNVKYRCDKTNIEIYTAYSNGKNVIGYYKGNKSDVGASPNADMCYFTFYQIFAFDAGTVREQDNIEISATTLTIVNDVVYGNYGATCTSYYYSKEEIDEVLYEKATVAQFRELYADVLNRAKKSDVYTKTEVDGYLETKQNTLTAGQNITISDDNVISATGGGGGASVKHFTKTVTLTENTSSVEITTDGEVGNFAIIVDAVFVSDAGTGTGNVRIYGEDGTLLINFDVANMLPTTGKTTTILNFLRNGDYYQVFLLSGAPIYDEPLVSMRAALTSVSTRVRVTQPVKKITVNKNAGIGAGTTVVFAGEMI